MDQDDGVRKGCAVGISLASRDAGTLRLILDDLELDNQSPDVWRQWSFFTFIDLPITQAKEHRLTEQEYAAIGEILLARLIALNSL